MTEAHPKPFYAYYGDDFTGSTDVLEALALHGVPAVLFTHPPEEEERQAFAECRAIGIAGESRSRTPQWMNRNLPAIFARMRQWGAPIQHYKVCSTFDSAPEIGNIGRAMELGRAAFATDFVPVVVGAPHLGRSVVFGNLFAESGGTAHRIDRHPTMRCHPVTPMAEADLRLHLAAQTALRIGLVDLNALQQGRASESLSRNLADGAQAVVFDGVHEQMLEETAGLLWERAKRSPLFAVGSSGLSYGLLRHWRRLGLIGEPPPAPQPAPVDRLLVLSGSCSPVTARQIQCAMSQGFTALHLVGDAPWEAQMRQAQEALAQGRSVLLYTALGPMPQDAHHGEAFGSALGEQLRKLLLLSSVGRIVVAGGDTASHAVQQLGLTALTFAAELTPGAPLCQGHAKGSPLDGLELVLKGGQIGPDNFFSQVRDGRE